MEVNVFPNDAKTSLQYNQLTFPHLLPLVGSNTGSAPIDISVRRIVHNGERYYF